MDTSRCLLTEAKVHNRFWPEIVRTAAYLKNRLLVNTFDRKTPYKILFGMKPDAKYLKIYGGRIFVRISEEKCKSKWDKKANLGVLLGYSDVGYRLLINNQMVVARHVDVVEDYIKLIGDDKNNREKIENLDSDNQDKNLEENSENFEEKGEACIPIDFPQL